MEASSSNPAREVPGDGRVAILGGTGALGYGLAVRWAMAGLQVTIGSRDAGRAAQAAERVKEATGASAVDGLGSAEAARAAEVVFLTVPFAGQAEALKGVAAELEEGQILVDCTVPLATAVGGKPTRTIGVWQGSAAQQARELVPREVAVAGALHSVSAEKLSNPAAPLHEDVLIVGDRKRDKARVAHLIEAIPDLRAVNAGGLEMARIAEQLTALMIAVNIRYKARAGLRLTDLPSEGHWD